MQLREFDSFALDDFIRGKKNTLFITGYMGSGKTTISKYFGKKYNAVVIELDILFSWNNILRSRMEPRLKNTFDEIMIKAGFMEIYDGITVFTDIWNMISAETRTARFIKAAMDISSPSNKIILEGVHIYTFNSIVDIIKDWPLIVMKFNIDQAQRSDFKRAIQQYNVPLLKKLRGVGETRRYYGSEKIQMERFLKRIRAIHQKK